MRLRWFFAALLPISFAACLSGSDSVTYPNIAIENTNFATTLGVNLAASTKTASGLYYREVAVGTGKTAVPGDSVNVYYSGYLATGFEFDSTRAPTTPYGFKTAANRNIPGFDEGVIGMKVGGTRQLIMPPALAYGASGNRAIPPNSVLVFNVQLVGAP